MTMERVTRAIAEFVVEHSETVLPTRTSDDVTRAFIDTIGVAIAGAHESVVTAVESSLRPSQAATGSASIITGSAPADSYVAAVVNATAGHAMDFDDHLGDVNGHPSVVLVPAILALSEEHDLRGQDMLTAYAIGHQVMCAVSAALPVRAHWVSGWHATETVGVLGSAAAASALLKLSVLQTSHALSIAASMAAGSRQNCGFEVKPVHAGMAAGNGVLAAKLASAGVDADPDQLEAPLGYFAVFGVDPDPSAVLPVLQEEWTISTRGLNVKAFPACYAVHPAAGAAAQLHQRGVSSEDIERVTVTVQPTGLTGPIHHEPQNANQARFSMEYSVAAALADGMLGAASFTDHRVADPKVRKLMARVVTKEAQVPPMGPKDFERWFSVVEVELTNGSTRAARQDMPYGYSDDPLSDHDLAAKFADCLATPGTAFEPTALLKRLESLSDNIPARTILALSVD